MFSKIYLSMGSTNIMQGSVLVIVSLEDILDIYPLTSPHDRDRIVQRGRGRGYGKMFHLAEEPIFDTSFHRLVFASASGKSHTVAHHYPSSNDLVVIVYQHCYQHPLSALFLAIAYRSLSPTHAPRRLLATTPRCRSTALGNWLHHTGRLGSPSHLLCDTEQGLSSS